MTEELQKNYKKEKIIYLFFLIITIIGYLLGIRLRTHAGMLFFWGLYFCQWIFLKRPYKVELVCLLGIVTLYEFDVYRRIDLALPIYFSGVLIYYLYKEASKYQWQQITAALLIVPLAMSMNFYLRKDKLIQDRGLEKCIQEKLHDYGYVGDIKTEKLEMITSLFIRERNGVYDLEEILYLKNLKHLYIDINGIKNLNVLEKLAHLKDLSIDGGKLSDLSKVKDLKALEELDFNYVDMNEEDVINDYQNLKILDIQGAELTDLSFLKDLKSIEELRLSYCTFKNMDGIEYLTHLKTLELYHTNIENIDKIKELKSLESVDLCESSVKDAEILKKLHNLINLNIRKDNLNLFFPK